MDEFDLDDEERKLPFYLSDIESFEQNLVWKEIVRTVQLRIDILNNELRTKTDLNDILKAQGEMLACEFYLIQTTLLKQDLKEQEEEEKQSKESEDAN